MEKNTQKPKILLTGANGKLGGLVLEEFLKKDYEVTVILRPNQLLNLNKKEILEKSINKPRIIHCELSSEESVKILSEQLKKTTHLVHLAGLVNYSLSYPEMFFNNVVPTINLINAAKLSNNKNLKIIYCSSTSVYRNVKKVPITNKDNPSPISNYGLSKLAAEKVIEQSGIDYLILRPPMIYGPDFIEQFKPMFKLLLSGKMPIIGKGDNLINLIYQTDVVIAFQKAIVCKTKNLTLNIAVNNISQNDAYLYACKGLNVTCPTRHIPLKIAKLTNKTINLIYKMLDKKPPLDYDSVELIGNNRWFDCVDSQKILEWKPQISPIIAIEQLAKEYLKSKNNLKNEGKN